MIAVYQIFRFPVIRRRMDVKDKQINCISAYVTETMDLKFNKRYQIKVCWIAVYQIFSISGHVTHK